MDKSSNVSLLKKPPHGGFFNYNICTIKYINKTPTIVAIIVPSEDFLLCASGRISDTPIYKRKPVKNPRYIKRCFSERVNNKVENPPRTGARESITRNQIVFLSVFLCLSINATVFNPSEKSC